MKYDILYRLMNPNPLSDKALSVIDRYLHFKIGPAVCSIPYFNNKHMKLRSGFGVLVGKGSPEEIKIEAEDIAVLEKTDLDKLDSAGLKKFLVDHNIGIDCSGFVFYLLDAESQSRGKGRLGKHISFINARGFLSKMKARAHPQRNADVATFVHSDNSREIEQKDAMPADIITMVAKPGDEERNHILVVHFIEYRNSLPYKIHYTHSIAWPTDGEYGHGVRQGIVEITDLNRPLTEQSWIEAGKMGGENYTFTRAQKSATTLRRLHFL